ncbi:MAG: hypothetical protein PUH03_01780 [bacterium]|nr:hypothetical protein [bacterium]MDY2831089.1 hypothetical protein [Alphaproteobacteria bacterium]
MANTINANQTQEQNVLAEIQQLLNEKYPGFIVTNCKAVQKEFKPKGALHGTTFFTSWCKKGENKGLAVLNGKKVKLLSEEDLVGYDVHSI